MKSKTLIIIFETMKQFQDRTLKIFKNLDLGKRIRTKDNKISVCEPSGINKIITPCKIQILQAIKTKCPKSIYDLARILGRSQPSVQADVTFMTNLGMIKSEKTVQGRKQSTLSVDYDGIYISLTGSDNDLA